MTLRRAPARRDARACLLQTRFPEPLRYNRTFSLVNLGFAAATALAARALRAFALQEVEIAALIGLHDVNLMHRAVASRELRSGPRDA